MPSPEEYAKRLAKGSAIVFTGLIAAGLVGFLLRMFLARSLSVADYGLFYAVFSLVSFFSLFRDLGLNSALVKYIPEFQVHQDFRSIKSAMISVALIQAVFAFLVAAVLFVFSDWFALKFFKSEAAVGPLQILSIWFFFMVFYSVARSVFQGLQNMLIYSVLEFSWITLVLFWSIVLVGAFGLGPFGVASAYLSSTLVINAFVLVYFRIRYRRIFEEKPSNTKSIAKRLFVFALPVFIGSLGGMILGYMDTIMLTVFRTLPEVGYYQAAQPTASILWTFVMALTTVLFPMVSELWAKRERVLLTTTLHFSIKFLFVLIVPAALTFIAFPDIILRLLFGNEYLAGVTALQILSSGMVVYMFFAILANVMSGINRPSINTKVVVAMACLNFFGNLLLIPKYGIEGAATTTFCSYLFGSFSLFRYSKKYVKFAMPTSCLFKTSVGGVLTLFLISGLKLVIVLPPWPEAFIVMIPSLIFYVGWIVLTKALTEDDLKLIAQILPMPKWLVKIARKFTNLA